MDSDTCRKTADNIAAELRDIDANDPDYPAERRTFLPNSERGFRHLAEEKGGYPVDSDQQPEATADRGPDTGTLRKSHLRMRW